MTEPPTQPIISPDGSPDGRPNLAADQYLRGLGGPAGHLKVLELGSAAGPSEVEAAICTDLRAGHSTNPVEQSASYDLALAEQRWSFGVDPSSVILTGGCPA